MAIRGGPQKYGGGGVIIFRKKFILYKFQNNVPYINLGCQLTLSKLKQK